MQILNQVHLKSVQWEPFKTRIFIYEISSIYLWIQLAVSLFGDLPQTIGNHLSLRLQRKKSSSQDDCRFERIRFGFVCGTFRVTKKPEVVSTRVMIDPRERDSRVQCRF